MGIYKAEIANMRKNIGENLTFKISHTFYFYAIPAGNSESAIGFPIIFPSTCSGEMCEKFWKSNFTHC